jgi:hypothetical protein
LEEVKKEIENRKIRKEEKKKIKIEGPRGTNRPGQRSGPRPSPP